MKRCEKCEKGGYIHTLCEECFPKQARAADRDELYQLMAGDLETMKPVRDFTDTKASEWPIENTLINHGGE